MEKGHQTSVEINTQDIIVKPLLNNNSVDEEAIDLTNDEDINEVKCRKSKFLPLHYFLKGTEE